MLPSSRFCRFMLLAVCLATGVTTATAAAQDQESDATGPDEPVGPPGKAEEEDSAKPRRRKGRNRNAPPTAAVGMTAGLPELLSFSGYGYLGKAWILRGGLGLPYTRSLPLQSPSYSYGNLVRFESDPVTFDVDVQYGPHLAADLLWFPGWGRFYVAGGLGFRRITATVDDSIPFRLCQKNASSCAGNGTGSDSGRGRNAANAASTTPSLHLRGSMTSTTTLMRSAIGWHWAVGRSGFIDLSAFGVSIPLGHSRTQQLEGNLEGTTLPSWVTGMIDNAINAGIDAYEEVIADALYDEYVRDYDELPLPLIGIGAGISF